MEDCKECPYVIALEKRVVKLEDTVKAVVEDVVDVKLRQAAESEQIKTIFEMVREIKDSINKIANKVEELQLKPSAMADKAKLALASAVISAVVMYAFETFIN